MWWWCLPTWNRKPCLPTRAAAHHRRRLASRQRTECGEGCTRGGQPDVRGGGEPGRRRVGQHQDPVHQRGRQHGHSLSHGPPFRPLRHCYPGSRVRFHITTYPQPATTTFSRQDKEGQTREEQGHQGREEGEKGRCGRRALRVSHVRSGWADGAPAVDPSSHVPCQRTQCAHCLPAVRQL